GGGGRGGFLENPFSVGGAPPKLAASPMSGILPPFCGAGAGGGSPALKRSSLGGARRRVGIVLAARRGGGGPAPGGEPRTSNSSDVSGAIAASSVTWIRYGSIRIVSPLFKGRGRRAGSRSMPPSAESTIVPFRLRSSIKN